jgi:hypothetical protein
MKVELIQEFHRDSLDLTGTLVMLEILPPSSSFIRTTVMSNSQVEGSSANTADDEPETAPPSIELNLRLDENGRTTFDPAAAHQKVDASVEDTNNNAEQPSKRAKTETESSTMDYSSKSVLTNLHGCKLQDAMDSLLFDCEVSDVEWLILARVTHVCFSTCSAFITR